MTDADDATIPWLRPLVRVRRDELPTALGATLLFFVLIASYYVAKAVREGVLIHRFDSATVPKLYIATCALTLPASAAFAALVRRVRRRVLLPAAYGACAAVFLGFAALAAAVPEGSPAFSAAGAAFFLWVSVYNVLVIALFWSFVNDLVTPEQGRRLYGVVGAGGILGGAVGGLVAARLAEAVGASGLLPLAALGLVLAGALIVVIDRGAGRDGAAPVAGPPRAAVRLADLGRVLRDPYVATIAAVVVLHTFTETTIDLQIKGIVKGAALAEDAATRFAGATFAAVNVVALVVQLLVTSAVHRRWGPRPGLLALPGVTLVAAPLLLWTPPEVSVTLPLFGTIPLALAVATAVGVPLAALAYSIQQASKELLYVPTDASVKYQAKVVIDTFGFRLGDTLAATLAMLAAAPGGVARAPWFAAAGWAACVVWCAASSRAGRAFEQRRAG